jgi:FkbH-like protein
MKDSDLFATARSLRARGRSAEALDLLWAALRRGSLGAERIEQAGRFLHREWAALPPPSCCRVLLLGQCTTNWLALALTAMAWKHRAAVQVNEGGYDTVLQDLARCQPGTSRPDVVVLLPWNHRLLGDGVATPRQRLEAELACWRQAWDIVGVLGARLIQVGYDWVLPGPSGYHLAGARDGAVGLVRELNACLREHLPQGGLFLDLEQISGTLGRAAFYDARRHFWTKQPFSEQGVCDLANHLWAAVRAVTTGPKKVLVVDLDNTLWGGVVGETGPLGIALGEGPEGEAYQAFQDHLKGLVRRGVLLAAASKNNPEDAREPFHTNPEMRLRLEDFAAFEACWEPKGVMIGRIAEALNLGLDSFVFFDDNPAEREQVRQALPEVEVVDVPEEPACYVPALQGGLWFEAVAVTDADRDRAAQYAADSQRRELRQSFGTLDDYLTSLEMRADVRDIDEADLGRVVQLIGKTNQFNLTTRRHSREDVVRMLRGPGAVGLTLQLADRFGDHGLVAVLLAVPEDDCLGAQPALRVDTWLMSCRVIGRTVEHFLAGALLDRARELGYHRIIGEYIPTTKNALVRELYPTLGLRLLGTGADGVTRYELDATAAPKPGTFVTATEGSALDASPSRRP